MFDGCGKARGGGAGARLERLRDAKLTLRGVSVNQKPDFQRFYYVS